MMSVDQARLEYLQQEREKVIEELSAYYEPEFPWTLQTKKQMLNEEIFDLLNKIKYRTKGGLK